MLSITLLHLLVSVAGAMPYYQVEVPVNRRDEASISKRQSEGVSWLCSENTCDLSGCPMSLEYGSGYPECLIYDTNESIYDNIVTTDANGQRSAFFSFPDPGPTCRFVVRSPASRDTTNCGTPALTVNSAACQRLTLASTFMLQFCCGAGDCEAAATKRSDLSGRSASSGALYLKNATTGEIITPFDQGPPRASVHGLSKRDCTEFVKTDGPYTSIEQPQRVSNDESCGPIGECTVAVDRTASQSRTLSASVSVGKSDPALLNDTTADRMTGDPWGVISASLGVDFTEGQSVSFSQTWDLPEGGIGYVVFTPYTTCYKGHFTGDCTEEGQEVEACYPEVEENGNLRGELKSALTIA